MKRLTLLRHAKAEWKNPKITDFERPLDRKGIAEIGNMGERLLSQGLVPDLIVTSPALRAVQTAESVARTLEIPARRLQKDDRLYLAPAEEILRVIHATGPLVAHLLIVGHNPGLSELARVLAPGAALEELAPGAVVTMRFDVGEWGSLEPGAAREVAQDSPRAFFQLWA